MVPKCFSRPRLNTARKINYCKRLNQSTKVKKNVESNFFQVYFATFEPLVADWISPYKINVCKSYATRLPLSGM